ncbi:MAG: hypothetical protein IJU42_02550 [Erysipelotrichaceae bacterium]|nr:hypothetical protein [Erysipelotrichaceae bacterium]
MNKKSLLLLLVIGFLLLSSRPLNADVGPKPSVTITVENAPDKSYYLALLSKEERYGPWMKIDPDNLDLSGKDEKEIEAYTFFATYKDEDGYNFLGNMSGDMQGNNEYKWTYYPPEEFKVAIYCPDDGTFRLSKSIEREAFNSYFTVDYSADDLNIAEDSQFLLQFLYFLLRVVLTVIIEFIIGHIMGFRSKLERRTIIIVNIITQVILNAMLMFFDYYAGGLLWMFMFPIGEAAVFLIELVIYLIAFRRRKKKLKTFFYTLIANAVTAGITVLATVMQWSL